MLENSNVFLAPVHSYLKPWYCFYIRLQHQRVRGKKWRQSQKPMCIPTPPIPTSPTLQRTPNTMKMFFPTSKPMDPPHFKTNNHKQTNHNKHKHPSLLPNNTHKKAWTKRIALHSWISPSHRRVKHLRYPTKHTLDQNKMYTPSNLPPDPTLHHPCSLNVFPSPTNKWSKTSHPIKAAVLGYHDTRISYMHYYFHDRQVFLTQAFTASTTASTVGDGGHPRGSTELDDENGYNCRMTHKKFQEFGYLVFGLDSDSSTATSKHSQGFKQTNNSFLNMILGDFATITNLHPVITQEIKGDRHSLARAHAQCTLLLIGADALTPLIIEHVWGANKIIRRNL
jgi:hypothetical protein